jgi:hypothetical protein
MVVCLILVQGTYHGVGFIRDTLMRIAPQLRNPNAHSFTHVELQRAMLETIASLNQYGEEVGVSEVCARKIE